MHGVLEEVAKQSHCWEWWQEMSQNHIKFKSEDPEAYLNDESSGH